LCTRCEWLNISTNLNLALDGGERAGWHSSCFTRGAIVPVTHCKDGWLSSSAVLDVLGKTKALLPYRISNHDLPIRIVVTIPTTLSRLPFWLVVEVNTQYIQAYHTVDTSTQYRVKCVDRLQNCYSHYVAPVRLLQITMLVFYLIAFSCCTETVSNTVELRLSK